MVGLNKKITKDHVNITADLVVCLLLFIFIYLLCFFVTCCDGVVVDGVIGTIVAHGRQL